MNDNRGSYHHSASEYWRGRRRNECTAAGWKIKRERGRGGEGDKEREGERDRNEKRKIEREREIQRYIDIEMERGGERQR